MAQLVHSSITTRCTTLCVININVCTVSCDQWRQGARQWVAQQRHLVALHPRKFTPADRRRLSTNWRRWDGLLNFIHLKLLLSRSNLTDSDGLAGDSVNLKLDFWIFKYSVNKLAIFHEKNTRKFWYYIILLQFKVQNTSIVVKVPTSAVPGRAEGSGDVFIDLWWNWNVCWTKVLLTFCLSSTWTFSTPGLHRWPRWRLSPVSGAEQLHSKPPTSGCPPASLQSLSAKTGRRRSCLIFELMLNI